MLTEREYLEKAMRDLLRFIPVLIELERERGASEVDIGRMVDNALDRVNEIREKLKKMQKP